MNHITIDPSIQRRIDRLHRSRAEKRAERFAATAMKAMDRCNLVTAEAIRLREENGRLMNTLHAIQGWPVRLMIPYCGEDWI